MAAITPDQARGYLERWELVRDVESGELRRTSMEAKLQQLSSLMASRSIFGPDPDREREIEVVRERWSRLRKALGG
jgi:hypothetical protein